MSDSVCKGCLCGCPEAVRTSSFDLSFKGHDGTFGVKGRILYLATLPLKGPENHITASAVSGEGIRAPYAHCSQPSAWLSSISCSDQRALLEQGCAPWKSHACLLEVGVKNWEQVTYEL